MTECTAEQFVDVPVPQFHEDMRHSGSAKKWVKDKGFGFITPDDGSDGVFIHQKELAVEALRHGETVSYDSEYDDRNYRDTRPCDTGYDDREGKLQDTQLLRLSEPIPPRDLPKKRS